MAALRHFEVLTASHMKTRSVYAYSEDEVRDEMARLKLEVMEIRELFDHVPEQRELIFHDTVGFPDAELKALRKRAKKQNDVVLQLFKDNPNRNFTPPEIFEIVKNCGGCAILTSIRRSITNLTKQGRLTKCMYSESRKGAYGTLNRTWQYNENWMPPISLPKDYVRTKNINYLKK
jgi:hypothetical protein